MPKEDMISVRAFTILTLFYVIGTSVLYTPTGLALNAKQDAWMAAILGIFLNAASVLLYVAMGRLRKNETLVQMCQSALGKWAGALLGLVFVSFFFLLTSLMIGYLGLFMTSQNLPETPIEVLQLLFILLAAFAVRLGKTVYSRAAEIFFPWLILLFALLFFSTIPKVDYRNFEPILEFGMHPVVKGAISFWGLQEMVVLFMIYPYVRNSHGKEKGLWGGTLIGGFVLVISAFSCIGVLGFSITSNQMFPAYTLAKTISIGHFLERIEVAMIFLWLMSIFLKIVLCFDAAVIGFSQVFRLKQPKTLVFPFALGIVVLAQMTYPNTVFVQEFSSKNWAPIVSIISVLIPALLYVILLIRSKMETSRSS